MSDLYDRAAIIPGRSLTRSKSPDRLLREWAVSADGATITAASGKTYLDLPCALGAVSLGYGAGRVWRGGGVASFPHIAEVEAAEAVLRQVTPWASHVRFTKTGSEACHAAYRIAKQATGRHRILAGDWAYHGWHEWCTPSAHLYAHQAPLWEHFDLTTERSIAAVFVEPHRWAPTDLRWLQKLRAWCDSIGALLILDSMIYGGRWALGGASEYFGLQPDLECFGKAIGNGQAVACVVGRDALRDHGELASGTYSGDPVGLLAVLDTLKVYQTEPVIETLWRRGRQLRAVLTEAIDLAGWTGEAFVEGMGDPHLRVRFVEPVPQETRSAYDYRLPDPARRPYALGFKHAMADRGVLWHQDLAFVMYAHTDADMARVGQAALESLRGLR